MRTMKSACILRSGGLESSNTAGQSPFPLLMAFSKIFWKESQYLQIYERILMELSTILIEGTQI